MSKVKPANIDKHHSFTWNLPGSHLVFEITTNNGAFTRLRITAEKHPIVPYLSKEVIPGHKVIVETDSLEEADKVINNIQQVIREARWSLE